MEAFHLYGKRCYKSGLIQFKSVDIAKEVISKSPHCIWGCSVEAKAACIWNQPDFVPMPPEQYCKFHILKALNDDCLREIFKYFSLLDLTRAAQVCKEFNQYAHIAFKRKHKTVAISNGSEIHGWSKTDVAAMLHNFGASIHSLRVAPFVIGNNAETLQMIGQHKTESTASLKHLLLDGFYVTASLYNDIRPLFANVKTLELESCYFYGGFDELMTSSQVEVLTAVNCSWNNKFINQRLEQLEEVHLCFNLTLSDIELDNFIALNPTIKKLVIFQNSNLSASNCIRCVSKSLPNLVELRIDQPFDGDENEFQACVENLSNLKSLRDLKFNFNKFFVTRLVNKFVENDVPIECFKLESAKVDDKAIQSMSKLKLINALEFENVENLINEHIIELAKEMPRLRELSLLGSTGTKVTTIGLKQMLRYSHQLTHLILREAVDFCTVSLNDYNEIVDIVQRRPKNQTLLIEITSSRKKVNLSEEILLKCRRWVNIVEKISK